MESIKEEKSVDFNGWIWGERKEESRTTRTTIGFLTWVTGWCHRENQEGGDGAGGKEGGDSSVWNILGLRHGWAHKPEGAAHLESSTREWSEEIEQMQLPKQRVLCEQWTQGGILNPHQHFRGGQKKRRSEKLVNNNSNKTGSQKPAGGECKEEGNGL